jgi:hypothetical protein
VPETVCEAIVHRDDGRVFSVRNPGGLKQVPPHDLRQFLAERELGWQTGFWGYVARGVVFRAMTQLQGSRPPHGDERSCAALRAAKDLLAEGEAVANAIASIALAHADDDAGRVAKMLADTWWPPHSRAASLALADVQRACRAVRQAGVDWQALAIGDRLRFHWTRRRNPLCPEHPLDVAAAANRRARGKKLAR